MKKRFLLIIPFLILLLVVIFVFFALNKSSKKNEIEQKLNSGKIVMMPDFLLPDLYDKKKAISALDLKGNYVLLNVFASWCSNCAAENEALLKISREGKIKVYGIAWRDIDKNTKDYLVKHGNPYERVAVDNKGIFSKLLFVSGAPESFLIDPEGRIIRYWKGVITE